MEKLRIFKQEKLTIANKVLISKGSFIQIRNITRIWHGRPNIDIPVFKLVLAMIVGTTIYAQWNSSIGMVIILATMSIIGYYIYLLSLYTLNIELSSGEVYAFTSLQKDFLIQSYDKIKTLINDEKLREEHYQINFNSCDIEVIKGDHNVSVKGKQNVVTKGENNSVQVHQVDNSQTTNHSEIYDSFNSNIEIKYELINQELMKLLEIPEVQSNKEDFMIIKEALKSSEAKDAEGLKNTLKKLGKKTIKIIENTSSLITIAEFLSKLLG